MYLILPLLCSALQLHIVYSTSPGVCGKHPAKDVLFQFDIQLPRTCLDLLCQGYDLSGVYSIHPDGRPLYFIDVYCDQLTDGGGWTVFQRRIDGKTDFYRNWQNYKLGFGTVSAEYWLGLDNIHNLLKLNTHNELLILLESTDNKATSARYGKFNVGDEKSGYRLTIGEPPTSKPPGDSLTNANNQKFTTFDRDQDTWADNCAVKFHGAWWYTACHRSNLNGAYHDGSHPKSYADGINWATWRGYHESLKTSIMMFREKLWG